MVIEVGDIVTAAMLDGIARPPTTRLIQQAAQTLANNTITAITFGAGSEDIDTHNFHDETTNNTRITPTVAGLYDVRAEIMMTAVSAASFTVFDVIIYKNGSAISPFGRWRQAISTNVVTTGVAFARVSMNGSTDYIEVRARQNSGANLDTQASGGVNSIFELARYSDIT